MKHSPILLSCGFLRAIAENPGDDNVRLVFADWLQENGEEPRAEFIRLQCELAKRGPARRKVIASTCVVNRNVVSFTTNGVNRENGSLGMEVGERIDLDVEKSGLRSLGGRGVKKVLYGLRVDTIQGSFFDAAIDADSVEEDAAPMRVREQELLRTHEAAWRRPECEKCKGKGANYRNPKKAKYPKGAFDTRCPVCNGTGSTGPLSELHNRGNNLDGTGYGATWEHSVTWTRGFPVVTVRWGDVGSLTNHDEWKFHFEWIRWACRCVRECAASFHVEGREPGVYAEKFRSWFLDNGNGFETQLPLIVFRELSGYDQYQNEVLYDTLELAHAALDAAITRLVVRQAYPVEVQS